MPVNPVILPSVNMFLQLVLLGVISIAAYRAKRKKQFVIHCRVVRWAVVGQLLAVCLIMLPLAVSHAGNPGSPFTPLIRLHDSLGILTILLWAYIELAFRGRLKTLGSLKYYMRAALICWAAGFGLGGLLYLRMYW